MVFGNLSVSATSSTVIASPTNPTIGTAAGAGTTVTVTLKTAGGSPVAGKTVTLAAASTSGAAVVTPNTSPNVTNADGQATFGVTDDTAEAVMLTATDVTDSNLVLSSAPTVTFAVAAAPTLSPSLSTVSASASTVPADGLSESALTVVVNDTSGHPMAGQVVTVTGAPQDGVIITPAPATGTNAPGTTDATGSVQFNVRDTTAEAVVLTAAVGTIDLATPVTVTFTAGTPDGLQSTVSASPTSVAADGKTASTVTVTLADHFGNVVAGKTVSLAGLDGAATITPSQATTTPQGVATFAVTDTTSEVVTFAAQDVTDNLAIAQEASVTFGTPTPPLPTSGDSALIANAVSLPADGTSKAVLTIELRDVNGYPVANKTVTLTASGGELADHGRTGQLQRHRGCRGCRADSPRRDDANRHDRQQRQRHFRGHRFDGRNRDLHRDRHQRQPANHRMDPRYHLHTSVPDHNDDHDHQSLDYHHERGGGSHLGRRWVGVDRCCFGWDRLEWCGRHWSQPRVHRTRGGPALALWGWGPTVGRRVTWTSPFCHPEVRNARDDVVCAPASPTSTNRRRGGTGCVCRPSGGVSGSSRGGLGSARDPAPGGPL